MVAEWIGEDYMEVYIRGRWSNELIYEMLVILDVFIVVVSKLKIN